MKIEEFSTFLREPDQQSAAALRRLQEEGLLNSADFAEWVMWDG